MSAAYLNSPEPTPIQRVNGHPSCVGKVPFASPQLASAVIARKARNLLDCDYREAYRCDFCGFWHVGARKHAPHLRRRS